MDVLVLVWIRLLKVASVLVLAHAGRALAILHSLLFDSGARLHADL